ncbi:hypothetical protein F4802DRAFT_592158 [Xylaria palmicola]|nr:hypothetical protein F4802DRAFT_592158 [Xylaria palmicola]
MDPTAQHRVNSYMATRNEGGDPVTALGVRGVSPESSVADRRAVVLRSLNQSLAQYQNGATPGDTSSSVARAPAEEAEAQHNK